jgi:hypothetical protein
MAISASSTVALKRRVMLEALRARRVSAARHLTVRARATHTQNGTNLEYWLMSATTS